MERGNCRAYIPAWYYDHLTGLCNEFEYGGCGGNDNRFTSREVCESSCSSDSKLLYSTPLIVKWTEYINNGVNINEWLCACAVFVKGIGSSNF